MVPLNVKIVPESNHPDENESRDLQIEAVKKRPNPQASFIQKME